MPYLTIWRPWEGALRTGRKGLAALLFFMQLSLVLWPAAARAAGRMELERRRQALLDRLAAQNAPPPGTLLDQLPAGLVR